MWNPFKSNDSATSRYLPNKKESVISNDASIAGDNKISNDSDTPRNWSEQRLEEFNKTIAANNLKLRHITKGETIALMHNSHIARVIVCKPIDDALRNWRKWNGCKAKDIEKREKITGLKRSVKKWLKAGRAHGGSVIVPLISDMKMYSEPFNDGEYTASDCYGFLVFDKYEVTKIPSGKTDEFDGINVFDEISHQLVPEFYQLPILHDGETIKAHYSWVTEFCGVEPLTDVGVMSNDKGYLWGYSVLDSCFVQILNYEYAITELASMVGNANIDVIAEEGMSDALTTEEEANIIQRASTIARMKKAFGILVQDKSSDFNRNTLTFSGIGDAIDRLQEDISQCGEMPVTLVFGKAKAGMSGDTNDGDIRNHISRLEVMQSDIEPLMAKLDQFIGASKSSWSWNSIATQTETERVKSNTEKVNQASKLVENKIISPNAASEFLQSEGVLNDELEDTLKGETRIKSNDKAKILS